MLKHMATDGNFIEFEGKFYAIDIDKLISWVTKKPEPSKDRTKVETWGLVPDDTGDNEFRVLQKEVLLGRERHRLLREGGCAQQAACKHKKDSFHYDRV